MNNKHLRYHQLNMNILISTPGKVVELYSISGDQNKLRGLEIAV